MHNRPAHTPVGEQGDQQGRPHNDPANDVQVDADDGGGEDGAPGSAGEPAGHGAPQAPTGHKAANPGHNAHGTTHGRTAPRSRTHGDTPARPDSGAGNGYSIPAEADSTGDMPMPAEAAEAIREFGGQLGDADNGKANADNGKANEDKSTNLSSHPAARIGKPAERASQLTLRTTAGPGARSVMLRCDPPGGTHPKAAEACADVAKSNGDLQQLPAGTNPRACFMIYSPVTATAQGNWHGQPVQFTARFPNTCVMRDKTGSVFDF
jgi:hypothetical protein